MTCHLLITNDKSLKFEVPLLLPSPNQLLCDCPHISTLRIVKERLIVHIWNKAAAFFIWLMEDDVSNPFRRMSMRTRKIAPKMAAALASSDNRTQAAIARLEALENDYTGMETVEAVDDDEASLDDDDDVYIQKKQKGTKRKTRQAKALENARKAPRNFLELLHEANLEALPPHVPSYLRAAVGPPSSTCRRHFCTVCGFTSNYTCAKCGTRFCSIRCQKIHDDTRCLKFVA